MRYANVTKYEVKFANFSEKYKQQQNKTRDACNVRSSLHAKTLMAETHKKLAVRILCDKKNVKSLTNGFRTI